MAYLIKIANATSYWTDNESSVWSDQTADAKSYSKKADANAAVEEIAEAWGYTLEVVDSKDAVSVEREEVVAEEAAVVPPLAGVPAEWAGNEPIVPVAEEV